MLDRHGTSPQIFASKLERYLRSTLHDDRIRIYPFEPDKSLPLFLTRAYKFYETQIAGRRCVLPTTREHAETPGEIAKHIALVRSKIHAIIIFAAPFLSAYNRSRLISQGVAFVVPGNQLYIPELAMDLREHFRAPKPRTSEGLSPAAQAVLFHHLLRRDEYATTPSAIARRLHYSAMSIGRAFDDLVAIGLATTERHGTETHLKFSVNAGALLETARPYLRSPVRSVKHIRNGKAVSMLKLAGESALAELTDLSRPRINTYAIGANDWKVFGHTSNLLEVDEAEAERAVETWSYDPSGLSDTQVVDRLSLYAQFWNHPDERVSMAAEKLLENFPW
jgi:DNA-binding MarR family transcriptional regulator